MTFPTFKSACFFSQDNGATVQCRHSAQEETDHPLPASPPVTNIIRFDETGPNNAALLTAWNANSSQFTMAGASVLKAGQVVTFDDPGLLFLALQNASALYTKASTTSDAFTRDEQAMLLALSFHALGLI